MTQDELKESVVKFLVTKHDFLTEDAEVTVDESIRDKPDLWNENAVPADLANYLADDDDDE